MSLRVLVRPGVDVFPSRITFAPIQSEAKAFYGVGDFPINSLSLVYMIVYIPMGFFAAQVIDRQSMSRLLASFLL